MTDVWVLVEEVDPSLLAGRVVSATCISGDRAAHVAGDGEVLATRRGVVATAFALPATSEMTPAGCYWRVVAGSYTWNVMLPASGAHGATSADPWLVGDPLISVTTSSPPVTWPTGSRLPAGGTAGQVLGKDSGTDYDVSWQTPSGGVGAVDSVNGQTGAVVLDAADVGADPAGSAATAQAAAISTAATDATAKVATETARATAAEAGRVTAVTANAKLWIGTAAAYAALGTYDATTLYVTT